MWSSEVKKNERNKASAFSRAVRKSRSEKLAADWRWTISVNLGWRHVPGEGGMLGGISVLEVVGLDGGVLTSAVVVAIIKGRNQETTLAFFCLEWENLRA